MQFYILNARPELFIWQCLPVPPVTIRPSIALGEGFYTFLDELTNFKMLILKKKNIKKFIYAFMTIIKIAIFWTFYTCRTRKKNILHARNNKFSYPTAK
jgi:hypothetical protein